LETRIAAVYENVRRVIIGKDEVIKLALTTLLARGHLLIEDAPGLGKTMLAKTLAQSLSATFKRIQFTPDLLPSDVTGVSIFAPSRQEFEFFPGPVFSQILLADEINRTSPRTQSSLLESMEERQVTVDGKTHKLAEPFFVVATQNPIELEGTYPLPEAQLDRFLMRIHLGYPKPREETRILAAQVSGHPLEDIKPVLAVDQLLELQRAVLTVSVSAEIQSYIVRLVTATRSEEETRLGASPRGSLAVMRAAQAHSFLHGFDYVTPDSVKAVAPHVLPHRILLEPQREYTGLTQHDLVQRILAETPVPTSPEGPSHASHHQGDPGGIADAISS
jgi:MoxR-like ATPase